MREVAVAYFLEFDHVVRGRDVGDIFRSIESWLRDQKGSVKESTPPIRIIASHGRALQPLGWRKDARKTIDFELSASGTDVAVRVRVIPAALNASDVRMRSDEARANWGELLAELWVRLGDTAAMAEAVRNPTIDWNASLRQAKGSVLGGAILLILGIAAIAGFAYPSPLMWIGTGITVTGVLSLMYGAMAFRSARRHLAMMTK